MNQRVLAVVKAWVPFTTTEEPTMMRLTRSMMVAVLAGVALLLTSLPAQATTTLGPYGYGKVKLGMTAKQAKATGKVVRKSGASPCSGWDLKAHPTGPNAYGLYISKNVGVAMIFAPKGVKTPEGIAIGSTKKQLNKAYPRLKQAASGYPYTTVPGNKKAYYYFLLAHGRIYEMGLALKTQDCAN